MNRGDAQETANAALALRAWGLRLLAGSGDAPPDAPPEAWRLFLFAERCALPVRSRAAGLLPADAQAMLEERSTAELQRVLTARGQLAEIAKAAAGAGLRAMVLKGGVLLTDGPEPIDVQDVDLLLSAADAGALAIELDRRGYRPIYADPEPGTPGCFHLAARARPASVLVELHYALAFLGAGFEPWTGFRPSTVDGLVRMAPPMQAWHVLAHAVVHHPIRRGALRELVVLAAALRECTPAEVAWLEARAGAQPDAGPLLAVLGMARALAAGREPDDAFRPVAAILYLLAAGGFRAPWNGRYGHALINAACAFAGGGGEYGRLWAGGPTAVLTPDAFQGGYRLDRWAPAVARAFRKVQRGSLLAAATPPGWMLARRALALARRTEAPPAT